MGNVILATDREPLYALDFMIPRIASDFAIRFVYPMTSGRRCFRAVNANGSTKRCGGASHKSKKVPQRLPVRFRFS